MSEVPGTAEIGLDRHGHRDSPAEVLLGVPHQEVARRVRRMLVVLTLLVALGMLVSGCAPVGLGGAPTATEPPTTPPGGYYGAQGQGQYGQAPAQGQGQYAQGQGQPAPAPADFASVTIRGNSFLPGQLNIRVGQKVSWNNEDQVAHTVTADGLTFGKSVPSGAVFNFAFVKPGLFPYHCEIHPSMHGAVVVS
jgi:plastocyanin